MGANIDSTRGQRQPNLQDAMDLTTEYNSLKALYNEQRPKSYAQVTELFETNFKSILKLVPLLPILSQHGVVQQVGEKDLHLLLEERTPYTGTFILTHQSNTATGVTHQPDIRFKVYFDAKLLEVLSVCNQTTLNNNHPFLAKCGDMDKQWELNRFMQCWLDYCLNKYPNPIWQTK